MGNFVSQLRLAEKAAEDIYFAKVSYELITTLHEQMQVEKNSLQAASQSSAETQAEDSPVVMQKTSAG